MKRHLNNLEFQNFVAGNYCVKELIKFSEHIAQCRKCKLTLYELSPDFFDQSSGQTGEKFVTVEEKHFSDDELQAFLKAEISLKRRLEMSSHIRDCLICKQKLYESDPELLKSTLDSILSQKEVKQSSFFVFNAPLIIFIIIIMICVLILLLYKLI